MQRKTLFPQDTISFANHSYTIDYVPASVQRLEEAMEDEAEDVLSQPLLERAGLVRPGEERGNRFRDRQARRADPRRR